jgi:NADH-quinone oxidoreductase subunit N
MFAVLFRLFHSAGALSPQLTLIFVLVALASMIVGNVLALRQSNVKRVLAYSSISHVGYVLVAFLAGGRLGAAAATFYFVAYFAMTLVAFGVVSALSTPEREAESIEDYRGLAWRQPWLAAAFTAALLSLAGIPLTAGFVGKFLLVTAGVATAEWLLVVTLVVTSTIGLVYYLRIVTALFAPTGEAVAPPRLAWPTGITLTVLALVILWLGLYPAPVVDLIQAGVASMAS